MYREPQDYMDNYRMIQEHFPGKNMLKIKEVAQLLGICDKTVKRKFKFNEFKMITIAS